MGSTSIRTPEARFSCQSCGRCCKMWSVTVDEPTVKKLRTHDWSDIGPGDPFSRNRGPGDPYRIRMVEGRCFFLDKDDRCQIHNRLGYDAKPAGCKAFPLHYTEIDETSYARLSFYCPTVSDNRGKRLVDQLRWLRAVRKTAGDVARSEPLRLTTRIEINRRELDGIDQQLSHWLQKTDSPVHERLAAGVGLLRFIEERVDEQGRAALPTALKQAQERELETMARLGRQGGQAAQAGPILSLFLGSDCRPTKWARLRHFVGVRLFNLRLAKLYSEVVGASASRRQIEAVPFEPAQEADALLTRYLLHKLEGKRHVAGKLDLMSGTNMLAVAYAIVNLLARLRAASSKHSQVSPSDVTAAIQAADLLVMEHTTINQKAGFAPLVETILAQRTLCGSLLARLNCP